MVSATLADLNTRATMTEGKKTRKWVKDDKPEAEEKPAFAPLDQKSRRAALYSKMKAKSDG